MISFQGVFMDILYRSVCKQNPCERTLLNFTTIYICARLNKEQLIIVNLNKLQR